MSKEKYVLNAQELMEKTGIDISDGYHTFSELYEHRIALFIALCKKIQDFKYHGDQRNQFGSEKIVWRSQAHSDGTYWEGWFILGINKEKGEQITYHLPIKLWDRTNFAETLSVAPDWDGHTPEIVLERLKRL